MLMNLFILTLIHWCRCLSHQNSKPADSYRIISSHGDNGICTHYFYIEFSGDNKSPLPSLLLYGLMHNRRELLPSAACCSCPFFLVSFTAFFWGGNVCKLKVGPVIKKSYWALLFKIMNWYNGSNLKWKIWNHKIEVIVFKILGKRAFIKEEASTTTCMEPKESHTSNN